MVWSLLPLPPLTLSCSRTGTFPICLIPFQAPCSSLTMASLPWLPSKYLSSRFLSGITVLWSFLWWCLYTPCITEYYILNSICLHISLYKIIDSSWAEGPTPHNIVPNLENFLNKYKKHINLSFEWIKLNIMRFITYNFLFIIY